MTSAAPDFANPFPDYLGIVIDDWSEDYVRLALQVEPHHTNLSGRVHGGLVTALLEYGAGLCGLYCKVPGNIRYGMTLSITCNFLAPADGPDLFVTARKSGGGRTTYFADAEIRGGDEILAAKSSSIHRYRTGNEKLEGVPVSHTDVG
ncbi:PaaI family thioesterase [Silicimonas algicola]|uniref:Uncharacterized protein (TIGR00369 family) n=1 Tax=Silicimonas algicola TaxID=1826607 RepID=A0A316FY65_9RHOB|nr:PaaI family thioesterase [Silicimonas algicola]AZQ68329.1 PaaI family thioesterase [Silicimonas algicola]PWK53601.1 uncharacterized protein (TIGR00369 family) [Silicimonas algicola]